MREVTGIVLKKKITRRMIQTAIQRAREQAALRAGKTGEDMKAGIEFVVYFLSDIKVSKKRY